MQPVMTWAVRCAHDAHIMGRIDTTGVVEQDGMNDRTPEIFGAFGCAGGSVRAAGCLRRRARRARRGIQTDEPSGHIWPISLGHAADGPAAGQRATA
jgi:hypothetical protein